MFLEEEFTGEMEIASPFTQWLWSNPLGSALVPSFLHSTHQTRQQNLWALSSQPSHPLSSRSPPIFDLSQHWGLFQWVFVTWRDVKHSLFSKPLVVTDSTYFSGAQWPEHTMSSYTCSLFTEQLATQGEHVWTHLTLLHNPRFVKNVSEGWRRIVVCLGQMTVFQHLT